MATKRAPKGMRTATVYGKRFYAHPGCISGFQEDRRYGLIYPVVGTGYMCQEDYSIGERFCAYCGVSNDDQVS